MPTDRPTQHLKAHEPDQECNCAFVQSILITMQMNIGDLSPISVQRALVDALAIYMVGENAETGMDLTERSSDLDAYRLRRIGAHTMRWRAVMLGQRVAGTA